MNNNAKLKYLGEIRIIVKIQGKKENKDQIQ